MSDTEFRCFMDLIMCSDPWPLGCNNKHVLKVLANNEAKKRGYDGWIEAYHQFMKL